VLQVSHDSLYDVLPGGLFHHIFSDFDPENRRLEFEKLKEEEKNARSFFLPFNDEFFKLYVKLELALRKYFKHPDFFIHHLLLFGKRIPDKYSIKLASYLLFADKIIGDVHLTTLCLSDILGHDVKHSENFTSENIRYNSSNIKTIHSPNNSFLGVDFICGDSVAEERMVWDFSILLEDDQAVENYIVKENKEILQVLNVFIEYFIPMEIEVRTNVTCSNLHPIFMDMDHAEKTEIPARSYLGYNTVI
jgi:hypothetical protein